MIIHDQHAIVPAKQLLFAASLFFASASMAQNLVPNPSFEQFTDCPKTPGKKNISVEKWTYPTTVPLDYFNRCSEKSGVPDNVMGYQKAKSGDAYIGLTLYHNKNYRSYAQVELSQPLTKHMEYTVEFWVSLSETSKFSIGNIGAYFTQQQLSSKVNDVIETYEVISSSGTSKLQDGLCKPQIKNNGSGFIMDVNEWTPIRGTFKAEGGEQFMTIGNFNTTLGTPALGANGKDEQAYYFIDDVMVYKSGTKPELVASVIIMPEIGIERNEPKQTKEIKQETATLQSRNEEQVENALAEAAARESKPDKSLKSKERIPNKTDEELIEATLAAAEPEESETITQLTDAEKVEAALAAADHKKEITPVSSPLQNKLKKVQVVETAETGTTILRQLFFEKNSAKILPKSEEELMMLADIISANPGMKIEISGHTDESGTESGNQKLSLERAQAVATFMQLLIDIDPSRFICKGFGSSKPLAENTTEEGRIKNRRVEFRLSAK